MPTLLGLRSILMLMLFMSSGTMLLDRKLDTFRALGCNRGAKYMFRSVGIKVAQSVVKAGYTPGGAKPENVLQLGGAFLVSKDRVRGKLWLSQ